MSDFHPGTVWLVGAGPGDPELLTRKAERLIALASVVFHDALVGPGILGFVKPSARQIYVGKRSGRHSQDQASIDQLIVAAALAGERVVRLKGGDPAIFGRATEELDACRVAGVPVSICPGVTAASAAAASLGASLTLRGLARKLVFVTAHAKVGEELELDWHTLASAGDTGDLHGQGSCRTAGRPADGSGAAGRHPGGAGRKCQLAQRTPLPHPAGSAAARRARGFGGRARAATDRRGPGGSRPGAIVCTSNAQ